MPWLDFDDEYSLKKAQAILSGTYRPEEWGDTTATKPAIEDVHESPHQAAADTPSPTAPTVDEAAE